MNDEELMKRHLMDLAGRAYQRNIPVFSDFLNLNELHILECLKTNDLGVSLRSFGGYDEAERQIAAFLPDAFCITENSDIEAMYPIACLAFKPLNEKFSEDLTHRDYLGALMHLGIERSCLGDILISEHTAYIFCLESMAELISRELTRVRHTSLMPAYVEKLSDVPKPSFKDISTSVSSVRLDAVIAAAFGLSRSKAVPFIEGGLVFVNSRQITSNAYSLKEGDLISVRGQGKCRYAGQTGQSRKGRIYIGLQRFI